MFETKNKSFQNAMLKFFTIAGCSFPLVKVQNWGWVTSRSLGLTAGALQKCKRRMKSVSLTLPFKLSGKNKNTAQEASLVPLYSTSPLHKGLAPSGCYSKILLFKIDKCTAKMRILKTMEPFQGEIGFCKCKNNASLPSSILEYTCIIARGEKPDEWKLFVQFLWCHPERHLLFSSLLGGWVLVPQTPALWKSTCVFMATVFLLFIWWISSIGH